VSCVTCCVVIMLMLTRIQDGAMVHLQGVLELTRLGDSCTQELESKLARAGHTATPVGDKLVVAGGILLSPSRTMDALVLDPARLAISR
jgi:hypothetical protein